MEFDEEHDDERGAPLLPPDDRLWRHPSEVGRSPRPIPRVWSIAVLAGTVGLLLGTGVAYLVTSTELPSRTVVVPAVERERDVVTVIAASGKAQAAPDVVAVTQRADPSIVHLIGRTVEGSAVMFRGDGFMLTSADGLAGATVFTAVLANGERHAAHLIGADPESGVAVVKLDGSATYPVAALGSTAALTNGAAVVAVSAVPMVNGSPAVAVGTVLAAARTITSGSQQRVGMIETDAPIAAGAWGGALLSSSGVVLGITEPGAAGSRSHYAAPIELASAVAAQLIKSGKVVYPWMGIQGRDGQSGGALIDDVSDASPAALIGLRAGDVITAVDGRPVASMGALMVLLRTHMPGDQVMLQVRRGNVEELIRVALGTRPAG